MLSLMKSYERKCAGAYQCTFCTRVSSNSSRCVILFRRPRYVKCYCVLRYTLTEENEDCISMSQCLCICGLSVTSSIKNVSKQVGRYLFDGQSLDYFSGSSFLLCLRLIRKADLRRFFFFCCTTWNDFVEHRDTMLKPSTVSSSSALDQ